MIQAPAKQSTRRPDVGLTTLELSRRSKITLRMLQWWEERGVVGVSRHGVQGHSDARLWDHAAIVCALVLQSLRRQGVTLCSSRSIIPQVFPELDRDTARVFVCGVDRGRFVPRELVFATPEDEPRVLIELGRYCGAVVTVDLEEIREKVARWLRWRVA